MQRHAEALGQWLEPEVKRAPVSKRALLAGVGILVVAGAYLAFRGTLAQAVGTPSTEERPATVTAEYPAPATSGSSDHGVVPGDSSVANLAAVDATPRQARIAPPSESRRMSALVNVARPGVPARAGSASGLVRGMVVPGTPPVAQAAAVMEMLLTPWAIVTIDGRVVGVRSRGINTLSAGVPHRLRFEREGFATVDTTVTLQPGERRALEIRLSPNVVDSSAPATVTVIRARPMTPGVLQMLVTPWASVSIDGRAGIRRARGADTLSAGVLHRLRFERPGFATVDTTITLQPGELRVLEVQMTPTRP